MSYRKLQSILKKTAERSPAAKAIFYKTGVGEYAAHDKFLGINVPTLRQLSREFSLLSLSDIQKHITSHFNEERLLALFILIHQYQTNDATKKDTIYNFYLDNLKYVNNWNLVDASAHLLLGKHLLERKKTFLLVLSRSSNLWERRIAIVATWYFIRHDQFDWTLRIAKTLLNDPEDLIHKAVGWMLREVGKRNLAVLKIFLNTHAQRMPRTMLRYAIEKFPETQRQSYLKLK